MDLLKEDELFQVRCLIGVSSVLSIVGSSFILGTYYFFPRVRSFPVKLLSMLSVSDLFVSGFHFSSVPFYSDYGTLPTELACQIQGGGIQFFSLAAFCWSFSISVTAYLVVVKKVVEISEYEKYFHLFCWGLPTATLIPLIVRYPDMGPNWCWVGFEGNDIRFALSYVPAIALLLLSILFYGFTLFRIFKRRKEMELESKRYIPRMQAPINAKAEAYKYLGSKIAFRLSLYVIIFVLCWIWAVINRLHVAIYYTKPDYFLFALQAWFTPLQGLFNAIVYGYNKQVRRVYREYFQSLKDEKEKKQKKPKPKMRPEIYVYVSDDDDNDDGGSDNHNHNHYHGNEEKDNDTNGSKSIKRIQDTLSYQSERPLSDDGGI